MLTSTPEPEIRAKEIEKLRREVSVCVPARHQKMVSSAPWKEANAAHRCSTRRLSPPVPIEISLESMSADARLDLALALATTALRCVDGSPLDQAARARFVADEME